MTKDLRDEFRIPVKTCGSCGYWWSRFKAPQNQNEPYAIYEAPCKHPASSTGTYDAKKSNYENGWRRASDKCINWEPN